MNKVLHRWALALGLVAGPLLGAGPLPGAGPSPGLAMVALSGSAAAADPVPAGIPAGVQTPTQAPSAAVPAPTQSRFGTQRLPYQSLVHQDRDRPGVIAEWQPTLQTALRGFVFHPDITAGPEAPAEHPALEHPLFGVVAEHAWPLKRNDTLTLTGGWVSGSDPVDADTDRAASTSTLAWSLGADGSLAEGRLRLALEQAGSSNEAGAGTRTGKSAEARRIRAEWRADRSRRWQWRAGAEYRWVGPDFESVANDAIRADRERLRSEGGIDLEDWRVRLSAQRERDNLAHDPSRRTEVVDRYQLTTTWSPSDLGAGWVLGRPQFTLAAEVGHNQRWLPADSEPEVSPYHRLRLESEFRTPVARWGVKAARGLTPGEIDSGQRPGVDMAQLEWYRDQRNFQPFPVRTQVEWQQREDRMTGTSQDRWQAGLRSRPIAMHERLGADFDLRYRHQVQSNTRDPQTDLHLGGRLVWTVDRPTPARSGLALTLNADFRDRPSSSSGDEDGYRLLLTLSSRHPFADW